MEYLQFLSGLLILLVSGNYLVKGGVSLARNFNISTLVVGVVVVSLGTSAPELVVSLKGALSGHFDVSTGTVIGSNISNIGLVLGFTAIIFPILIHRDSIRIDWPIMMFASILLCFFISDGIIQFYEGLIFFILLMSYIIFLLRKSKRENNYKPEGKKTRNIPIYLSVIMVIISSFGLAFGADWLVKGGSVIASNFGISESVIALTVYALGTSLPELTTSVIAAFKKESDISVGNIIGSNIFNIFGILGITALVKNIPVDDMILNFHIWWMLGISLVLFLLLIPFKKVKLSKFKGAILCLIYISYWIFVFIK